VVALTGDSAGTCPVSASPAKKASNSA